ncbi:MAG: rRNA pseudouridine synthase [Firmicutes bacterium]|nr:rRNA pseudouridine synthase [Bacillota bacterium]
MEKIRIQKYFSEAGVMSRRAAEAEIASGHITVNGKVSKLGDTVDPDTDTVRLKGRKIVPRGGGRVYIMLNKPVGVVSTLSDEEGRQCLADYIKNVGVRVFPIGRLDMYSDGLLLLTNDGEAANAVMHPSGGKTKVYRVVLSGKASGEDLNKLSSPMTIKERDGSDYTVAPCPVKLILSDEDKTVIEMTLHEGRNRQIRRMCETLGLRVRRLTRISEGGIELGSLPTGHWRHLTEDEISLLLPKK